MHIGVVGTGTIATAVVHGIAGDGHEIVVSERSHDNARALADAYGCVSIQDNQGVVDASEVVLLGLVADVAPSTLGTLRFREGQRVISFMAGASLDEVAVLVGPAIASAVVMPFPAIASGGSAVIALGDVDLVRTIFGVNNEVFAVESDEEMSAYLCAQAVLSPVTQMVSDTAEWLAEKVADGPTGEAFLRHLIASSLSASECAPLLKALGLPGGYNQRLHAHMTGDDERTVLRRGLDGLLES